MAPSPVDRAACLIAASLLASSPHGERVTGLFLTARLVVSALVAGPLVIGLAGGNEVEVVLGVVFPDEGADRVTEIGEAEVVEMSEMVASAGLRWVAVGFVVQARFVRDEPVIGRTGNAAFAFGSLAGRRVLLVGGALLIRIAGLGVVGCRGVVCSWLARRVAADVTVFGSTVVVGPLMVGVAVVAAVRAWGVVLPGGE